MIELRAQRRSIDLDAVDERSRDATGIDDVVEWARVEHEEIGPLTGNEAATVVEIEILGGSARCSDQHLRGRHARIDHRLQLEVLGEAEEVILDAGIGAEHHVCARGVEPG